MRILATCLAQRSAGGRRQGGREGGSGVRLVGKSAVLTGLPMDTNMSFVEYLEKSPRFIALSAGSFPPPLPHSTRLAQLAGMPGGRNILVQWGSAPGGG